MDYFIFVALFTTATNPFWTNRIRFLHAGKNIFFLKEISAIDFVFSCWQSFLFLSLTGFLFGLCINFYMLLPTLMAMMVGFATIWTSFFCKLFIMNLWLRHDKCRGRLKRLFNVLAASWLLVGILLPSLILIARGSLTILFFAAPLYAYYMFICGRVLSAVMPNFSICQAISGELIALTAIAAILWRLNYSLNFYTLFSMLQQWHQLLI